MRIQAQEELIHATLIYDYVNGRGGRVRLAEIAAPPAEWASPLAAFEQVCEHERKVTLLINDLVALALQEKDVASNAFLQWFVTEQVEEEASAAAARDKLNLLANQAGGMYVLDREMAARVFTPPAIWVAKG